MTVTMTTMGMIISATYLLMSTVARLAKEMEALETMATRLRNAGYLLSRS
jgi:hypothetical protein